jgi:signal transduction histidine kinase
MRSAIASDIERVGRIRAVPTILEVVMRTTGLRFVAVARVTETHWTACAVRDEIAFGLAPGGELVLETTLCNEVRQSHQPIVFGHASADPRWANHHTPKHYGLESYISVPIFLGDGQFFGTLCAIDPQPHELDDPNIVETLQLFAQLIGAQLDLEGRLESSTVALVDAREDGELREQFIAVLGHDLRSPLHAIRLGGELLRGVSPAAARTVAIIERSCTRMSELIDNVLDFARGRLGGGIPLELVDDDGVAEELRHVVVEVRTAFPDRAIEEAIVIEGALRCDHRRLAQLLSNLLTNAVVHGAADKPVRVEAHQRDGAFVLVVSNGGEPIPEDELGRLFHPFARASRERARPGLGLGLYIAAEIARAHGGTLEASSSADLGTRFTLRMPSG